MNSCFKASGPFVLAGLMMLIPAFAGAQSSPTKEVPAKEVPGTSKTAPTTEAASETKPAPDTRPKTLPQGIVFDQCAKYSENLQGVGLAIIKGAKETKYTLEQTRYLLERGLSQSQAIPVKAFAEEGKGDYTGIIVCINGHMYGDEPFGLHNITGNFLAIGDVYKGGVTAKREAAERAARPNR
jgi:hypothetical protein